MNPFDYLSGHIPPKVKTVGHAVVAGAIIGGATGGLAEMARGFGQPAQPARRAFTETVNRQRQHKNHGYHSRSY